MEETTRGEILRAKRVPLPEIEIQRRIVAHLDEQMTSAERLVKALEAQLEAIQSLPATLLHRAFSGKLYNFCT